MSQLPSGSVPPPPPVGGAKVVIAAISLGLIAVIILSFYIQSVKDQVAAQQFTVFVLNRNIKPNDRITANDWTKVSVPDKQVFRDGFKGLNAFISNNGSDEDLRAQITGGKQWEIAADKGAVITHAFFTRPADQRDQNIEEGKVRIALPIKSTLTPGGLRPGMNVDIAAPMLTGGQIPQTMIVMQGVKIKAVGTYTLAEEGTGDQSRTIRSFNSVSIDVEQDVAIALSTLEKMVKVTGQFELFFAPDQPRTPEWEPGKINPKVLELVRKNLPAK